MNNKHLAALIITLCFISIIVGIINSNLKVKTSQIDTKTSAKMEGIFTTNKLALIVLNGPISADTDIGFSTNLQSAPKVKDALNKALKDKSVKGVLLRVNSPGGTVGMSQEIYRTILKLRKEKPVVVSMGDIAASGGYYISSAADRIYANEGTLTGSVGVIMGTMDFHKLMNEKLGVTSNVIKSGQFKDTGTPYRAMNGEEKQLLQNIINTTYGQFVGAIRQGRVKRIDHYSSQKTILTDENLKKYTDGRIFTGEQAISYGFVDGLGGVDEAQKALEKMAIEKFNLMPMELPLVNYGVPSSLSEFLYGISESAVPAELKVNAMIPFSMKYSHQPLLIWE